MTETPNIDDALLHGMDEAALLTPPHKTNAPRILMLYGSLRPRSFSRLSAEGARVGDVRIMRTDLRMPQPSPCQAAHN